MPRFDGQNRLADLTADLGQTNHGTFPTLISIHDAGNGGKKASQPTIRKALQFQRDALAALHAVLPNSRMPYSFFACVLSLPATIIEPGDNGRTLYYYLISDRGFTFWESRPLVSGAFSIPALIAAVEPWLNSESKSRMGTTLQKIMWTESDYISEAKRRFELLYHHEKDEPATCPKLLRTLEDSSGVPELFRRQMLSWFTSASRDDERLETLEGKAEHLDCVYYREPLGGNAVLKEDAENSGISVEHNSSNEPVAFTLRQAMVDLNVICEDLLREREEAISRVATLTLSNEAERRLQEQKTAQKRMESFICQIPKMTLDLPERVQYQKRHPNGIQGDDALSLIRAILINEGYKASPDVILKDIPAQETFQPELYESIADIFAQHYEPMKSKSSLREVIRFALWSELSVLDDDDEGEVSVSYAPVITYLVFKQYHKRIKESDLVKVSLNAVFGGFRGSTLSEETATKDFQMYCDLCRAYQRHYAEKYTTEIQLAWDMAFLHYSGYSRLFENPNLLRVVRQKVSFAAFEGTNDIDTAVDINRIVNLSHSHVLKTTHMLERFHPTCETDPGWKAVQFFRSRLMLDERANDDRSCFARYIELIKQPYGEASIREFLECSICLLCGGRCGKVELTSELTKCHQCANRCNRFQDKNYADLFSRLFLGEVFTGPEQRASFQQGELFAVLEYTLRLLAAERCTSRLYRWYYHLLCKTAENEHKG